MIYYFKKIILLFIYFSFAQAYTGDDQQSSKLLLSCKIKNEKRKTKKKKEVFLKICHLGIEYTMPIHEHFGGQCLLQNTEIETKYYILVSRNIEALKRKSIYGHKVHKEENSKLYVFTLITANKEGDLTYNWEIDEMNIPKRQLPEKTIIIYADPSTITFEKFENSFNSRYPSKESKSPLIILPSCCIEIDTFEEDEYKNDISCLEIKQNHVSSDKR